MVDALYYIYDLVMSRDFQSMREELKIKILESFSGLIQVEEGMKERIRFLRKCIEDIKKNEKVSHLLKIIRQIIGSCPLQI